MMSNPRKKGFAFEREVCKAARDVGLPAQRAYASDGRSLGERADVDVVVASLRIQCRRRRKIASFLRVPDGCDIVCFREDRGGTLVLMPYEKLLELLSVLNKSARHLSDLDRLEEQ